jgi:hypothetical protein
MIRHIWSLLCRSSVIDKDSNALSIFDTFEELTILQPVDEPGIVPFSFQLVTLWARADGSKPVKGRARMVTVNPGQDEGAPTLIQIDLTQHTRLRQRVTFGALKVKAAGVKEFRLDLENEDGTWQTVARIPLEIKVEPRTPALQE